MTEAEAERYLTLDIIQRWTDRAHNHPDTWKGAMLATYANVINRHAVTTGSLATFNTFFTVCASALTEDERVAALVRRKLGLDEENYDD